MGEIVESQQPLVLSFCDEDTERGGATNVVVGGG